LVFVQLFIKKCKMRNHSVKGAFIVLLCSVSYSLFSQNVAINTSGDIANTGALLDLSNQNSTNAYSTSATAGFLAPWVTLTSLSTLSPIAGTSANLTGLMVYNTGGTLAAGLYYWSGAAWEAMGSVTGGNDGTSVNGTNVILGNAVSTITGQLTQNTEIPLNGYYLSFSAAGTSTTPGEVGVDLAAGTAPVNSLDVNGSVGSAIASISAATTLSAANSTVIATPSSAYTITLPAVANSSRRVYTIVYNGYPNTNTITIKGNAAENIVWNNVSANTYSLNSGTLQLQTDGIKWYILNPAETKIDMGEEFGMDGTALSMATGDYYAMAGLLTPYGATYAQGATTSLTQLDAAYGFGGAIGFVANAAGVFSSFNGWVDNTSAAGKTATVVVYKYTATANTAGTANLVGTQLGSGTVTCTTKNDIYQITANSVGYTPSYNAGDIIVLWFTSNASDNFYCSGTIELISQ
jgi:hypothetical protein